jgi:GntR family transcriptional regulator
MVDPKITFSLNAASGTPIYRQIIQQIEYAILSERLKTGDRLPTIRALSVELRINPNTIAKAYSELEIRGILTTQVGSGTFISDKKPESMEDIRNQKIQEVLGRFMQELKNLGLGKDELLKLIQEQF